MSNTALVTGASSGIGREIARYHTKRGGDLVITADIPLAAEVIEKGGQALTPRGEQHTKENIRGRLNMRDFMDTMRASGVNTGGPQAMSQRDRQAFANHLDTLLARR